VIYHRYVGGRGILPFLSYFISERRRENVLYILLYGPDRQNILIRSQDVGRKREKEQTVKKEYGRDRGLAEHYTIKIEIPAIYIKILHLPPVYLLFGRIIGSASRFFSPRTSGINRSVWFEECPKQIIRNLTILKE
jgi:hypothetical protein